MNVHNSILHVDMNNFYASVECLYDPALRGRPVAVGGSPETRHGIILAKNEIAKAYGVKTGEALWQAREKCPDLTVVPPHYDRYLRFSRLARDIYETYTDQVEPFGLDECWLDITASCHTPEQPWAIAQQIRCRVKEELGVTVSIGISFNKVFAKLGSDLKKPDAVTELTQDNFRTLVWPLPAEDLLYVGPATRRKLYARGVTTIGAIANTDRQLLESWFGKWGLILYRFANGLDTSPVRHIQQESLIKSLGNSTTTPVDICTPYQARIVLWTLAESVASRLREHGLRGRTVQISLRDSKLFRFERQLTLPHPTNLSSDLLEGAMTLLERHYTFPHPLRSIGLKVCNLCEEDRPIQLSLFENDLQASVKRETLEKTVDQLRSRFGHHIILRGSLYTMPAIGMLDPKQEHTIHPVGYFGA